MKQIFLLISLSWLFGITNLVESYGQQPPPVHNISMDVAILNYRLDSIAQNPCGNNYVYISFDIQNKFRRTIAQCAVDFKINGINVTNGFEMISPASCEPGGWCFQLIGDQTKRIRAKAKILFEWIGVANLVINLRPYNNGEQFHFYENVLTDNTIERFVNLNDAITEQNSFCTCSAPGNGMIDTTALYVIQSYVKKSIAPNPASSAQVAIPFNLRPSLTISDAARFKFRFAGYYNGNVNMIMYTIEFSGVGLFLTRDGNTLICSAADGTNKQKWVLKKNSLGGYGIFSIKEPGRPCRALGVPASTPALPDSPVSLSILYSPSNIYQHFNLIKLQ